MPRYVLLVTAAGEVAGVVFARTLPPFFAVLLAAAAFASVVSAWRSRLRPWMLALALGGLAGVGLGYGRPDGPALTATRTTIRTGVVVACSVAPIDGFADLTLRLDDGTTLTAQPKTDPLPIGARVRVRGRVEPVDVARNPGEPSPRDLARERGVDGELAHATILEVGAVDAHDLTLWPARLRAWATARLHEQLDEPYATILGGALYGDRGTLPRDLRAEFQDTGTTHILVTAGLHLGVIATLAVLLFRAAGCGRISASIAAIAVVWLYAGISGGHVPSLRAATMASFALSAHAAGRRALSWNALAAAAIVVTAIRPSSVTTVSFALSFSCVGAIVLFAEPFGELLARCPLPHVAREAIALTAATQLGTWPLTAATFLVITPYAPVANALVVPFVGVAMLLGLATLACTPLPIAAHLCANLETSLLMWIVGVVRTVASLPAAHIVATPPPIWAIAAYDGIAIGAAAALRHERYALALAALVAACWLCIDPPRAQRNDLRITVIDVGQADAILIETPRGHSFLVDAGGRLERGDVTTGASQAEAVGERIVVPFLIRQGIHRIDALLMSHPHGDHVGGALPVLRSLQVDAVADSGQAYPGRAYQATMAFVRDRRLPVLEPRGGALWRTDDGVAFRFYGPVRPYIRGSRSDINSNSLVFRLEYGHFAMLFMGDAGTETEQRLLATGRDLRAEVLKVGHHGSAYGTTDAFVQAVAPRFAVISVGRHNLFGHPSTSTIAELAARAVETYRTDLDGATTIESDGDTAQMQRFIPQTIEQRSSISAKFAPPGGTATPRNP